MTVEVINKTNHNLPQKFLVKWVELVKDCLSRTKDPRFDIIRNSPSIELAIVFLETEEARRLNLQYRKKDYATDILSFESFDRSSLGELVLCYDVIKQQSEEHELSFQQECAYMILHGILHLLGFEHEDDVALEQEMFLIQDDIFEELNRGKL